MKSKSIYRKLLFVFAFLGCLIFCTDGLCAKEFVVVIDPGHGGKDPGAVGKTAREKNINLKVALKLGDLITKNCKDVKVIYTRKTDVFIPLDRRAQIANNAKADLFISIHTNSVKNNNTARGASTYTLGLSRTAENLAVAKRENGVIMLENDYKTTYAGFDPNSSESYIIFEYMQDQFMENSVSFASTIQKEFKNRCKRNDRGVHQAEFLVLKNSVMPSVLVELGFISNPTEEKYLSSEAGSSTMANGLYQAFLTYKKDHSLKRRTTAQASSASGTKTGTSAQKSQATSSGKSGQTASANVSAGPPTVFKVQFLTSSAILKKGDKRLKGITNFEYYKEGGVYKYTCGASQDYNRTLRTRKEIASKFGDAFIIAFQGDKKVNVNQAIEAFKKKKK